METSLEVSRQILYGIAHYAKKHGPWILEYISGGISDQRLPEGWDGDGIIARVPSEKEAKKIAGNPAPKVILDPQRPFTAPKHPISRLPRVECDNAAIGRMAAKHFLSRKFTNFAFIGPSNASIVVCFGAWNDEPNWSEGRRIGYTEALAERGFEVNLYKGARSRHASANWTLEMPSVIEWIKSLPKPVAVFAPHDARARQVADACLMSGIPVPYSVAILGVNNDSTLCDTTLPPLSSIPLDAERAGYTAAHKLDALMKGRKVQSITLYNPLPVATRDSTLQLQTEDALVIGTLEKIRKAHGFNMRVGELAHEAGVTTRTLEARFRAAVGRSVGNVIRTSCLDEVRKLVESTDTPLAEIANLCGQQSAAHLADVFRRRYGLTMSAARRAQSSSRL